MADEPVVGAVPVVERDFLAECRSIGGRLLVELRRATNAEPDTVTAKELELLEGED